MITKTQAKNLLPSDFVPGGKQLTSEELRNLKFRRTTENEIFQCCVITGEDIQSGPYFCGQIAEFVAFSSDSMVALCGENGHVPPRKP